jgi:putative transcriptional regulator
MPRIEGRLNIKNAIYTLRTKRNVTQQELADEVGVTRATIIAIEKESYNPSLELAFRLSNYFDTKIENLFFLKEK